MKKEELMKLEGMTEELAAKIAERSAEELRGMIPKTRFDEVIAERDSAKTAHADVLKQLGSLQKDADSVEELRSQIKKLQNDATEAAKTHAAELQAMRIDNAATAALLSAKALNVKAVKALLNLTDAEIGEDGTVKGLADQIKALQAADDSKFLFGSSTMKGAKAGESGNEDGDKGVDTSQMTYSELAAYAAEHPDYKFE